jgi:GNAT superfamily N-acetyltransferase
VDIQPADARPATPDEVPGLVRTLVRAFEHDPYYRWMFPDDATWEQACHLSFDALLRRLVPYGTVLTTPELDGCISWFPFGYRPGFGAQLAHAGRQIRIVRIMGLRHARVVRRGLLALHARRLREPHITACVIGMLPESQGAGRGSALLAALIEHLERTGHVTCGIASSEAHVAYYRRFGVETEGDPVTLPGGPTVWPIMYRPKRAR